MRLDIMPSKDPKPAIIKPQTSAAKKKKVEEITPAEDQPEAQAQAEDAEAEEPVE